MVNKKLISFVIPSYNEAENIPELVKQLARLIDQSKQYLFEIILVEHGSTDNSFELMKKFSRKDKRFKILQLSKNFGYCDPAITAGLKYVKGDAAVIMMADLEEPLETVVEFLKKWEKGYEIVYGVVKKRTASRLRNLLSSIFYRLINSLTNNMFPPNASDFRLIDKKVYETINRMGEQGKYLRGLIMWTGFKSIGVPFNRRKRFAGVPKSDLKTVFKVAANGIFSFSYVPLRVISVLGFIIMIASFLMALIYLYLYFLWGRVTPGAATIIIIVLFLFGTLFFVLGIISEYLARIYEEVKGRPTYIVKDKYNL